MGHENNDFKEALLGVMEQKEHWAWPMFTSGRVKKELLHIHLEQEYEVFVRDFPVLVARAYVQCPVPSVRRELVENVYEEETGGLAAGKPHPELFMEYPKGLGMDVTRFDHVVLLPAAAQYRAHIDACTLNQGWELAAAISTLFLEGTKHDRAVFDVNREPRPEPRLEDHPLVKHYGLPLESLALTKAHRGVEGSHRLSAWTTLLNFGRKEEEPKVIQGMQKALELWKKYRDEVAIACGLSH